MQEKLANLALFPDYLDCELTNHCNLTCTVCPTGMNISSRPKGFISSELMRRIIQECAAEGCKGIRFVRWGEPLLHPHCVEYIKAVKSAGLLCHINTNGSLLDDGFISDILKYGLDSIKFSFQGLDEYDYNSIRKGGDYKKLVERITNLYSKRNQRQHPYIQIGTTIASATKSNVNDIKYFNQTMLQICDRPDVGITRNLLNNEITTNYPECPEMFNKLSINWNGDITMCCSDWDGLLIVGNCNKQSLKEIWTCDAANKMRQMLVNHQHNLLPVCRSCIL